MSKKDEFFAVCAKCGAPYVFPKGGDLVCATVITADEIENNKDAELMRLIKLKVDNACHSIADVIETKYKRKLV